jgi:hypothetical protein
VDWPDGHSADRGCGVRRRDTGTRTEGTPPGAQPPPAAAQTGPPAPTAPQAGSAAPSTAGVRGTTTSSAASTSTTGRRSRHPAQMRDGASTPPTPGSSTPGGSSAPGQDTTQPTPPARPACPTRVRAHGTTASGPRPGPAPPSRTGPPTSVTAAGPATVQGAAVEGSQSATAGDHRDEPGVKRTDRRTPRPTPSSRATAADLRRAGPESAGRVAAAASLTRRSRNVLQAPTPESSSTAAVRARRPCLASGRARRCHHLVPEEVADREQERQGDSDDGNDPRQVSDPPACAPPVVVASGAVAVCPSTHECPPVPARILLHRHSHVMWIAVRICHRHAPRSLVSAVPQRAGGSPMAAADGVAPHRRTCGRAPRATRLRRRHPRPAGSLARRGCAARALRTQRRDHVRRRHAPREVAEGHGARRQQAAPTGHAVAAGGTSPTPWSAAGAESPTARRVGARIVRTTVSTGSATSSAPTAGASGGANARPAICMDAIGAVESLVPTSM